MERNFWARKWEANDIGFHKSNPNVSMTNNFDALSLSKPSRVFLPLCGKTQDIAWLLANGYQVAGAELIETAIDQLFAELEVEPSISKTGDLTHYSAENIDIYVGDIFDLTSTVLGKIDAVYDRAALVALPEEMRNRYTSHLISITQNAPQLLISYEYDQTQVDGPPFSVVSEEIARHYGSSYKVTQIGSKDVLGGMKGICEATEKVWLLKN